MAYAKIHQSILHSSIWQEDATVKLVWITMLVMADQHGEVMASIPGLAKAAGVTIPDCEAAVARLMEPDQYSRTPDCEGRRVESIDGGWAIINHAKYRHMASLDDTRSKAADRQRRKRERDMSRSVTPCHASVTVDPYKAEAEAEAELKTKEPAKAVIALKRFQKPSLDQVREYGQTLNPPFTDCQQFIDYYEAIGWKVGRNPMKDWQATVRTWHRKRNEHPSLPTGETRDGMMLVEGKWRKIQQSRK